MTLGVAWLAYGTLEQPTGGYVYDRLIVEHLRACGAQVEVHPLLPEDSVNLADTLKRLLEGGMDVVVGDALCINELGPMFEAMAGCLRRVLLVHHLTSWENEASATCQVALRAQELRAIRSADLVVTTSQTTASRLCAEHPGCVPYTVVPGADRLTCLPRAQSPTDCRLLGIGSLVARKRWELLLAALDELAAPGLYLRLIGDDTRDPAYARSIAAQLARSPYLAAHVEYMGVVTDEDLAGELACADALVLPSSLEGYGMVLTEALHAGLPVVASRASAVPEILKDNAAALLFDDESELVVQLNRLASEPTLRDAMQRAAARCAATLPTWSSAGARFRELLTQGAPTERFATGPSG